MNEDLSIDDKINIIGDEFQTIHIILEKNKKININKNNIIYASSDNLDEVLYKNTDILIANRNNNSSNNQQKLKKVENESIVRLKNLENNIEYIGLSKGGKILKISPFLYTNFFVRVDNILAFSDNLEILSNKEIDNKISRVSQQNFFVKNFGFLFDTSISEFCAVHPLLSQNNKEKSDILDIISYTNCNIYLSGSGKGILIEKRLGENETMSLMVNSIIAFEGSVSFFEVKKEENNFRYLNNQNDIMVEGPGLIIFELAERQILLNNQKRKIKIYILFFIFCVLKFIAFLLRPYLE